MTSTNLTQLENAKNFFLNTIDSMDISGSHGHTSIIQKFNEEILECFDLSGSEYSAPTFNELKDMIDTVFTDLDKTCLADAAVTFEHWDKYKSLCTRNKEIFLLNMVYMFTLNKVVEECVNNPKTMETIQDKFTFEYQKNTINVDETVDRAIWNKSFHNYTNLSNNNELVMINSSIIETGLGNFKPSKVINNLGSEFANAIMLFQGFNQYKLSGSNLVMETSQEWIDLYWSMCLANACKQNHTMDAVSNLLLPCIIEAKPEDWITRKLTASRLAFMVKPQVQFYYEKYSKNTAGVDFKKANLWDMSDMVDHLIMHSNMLGLRLYNTNVKAMSNSIIPASLTYIILQWFKILS